MGNKRRNDKAKRQLRNKAKREQETSEFQMAYTESQKWYAEKWPADAKSFEESGHYEWMAGFVSQSARIFEIGSGEGSGTLALCKNGAVVVSIEENPQCIEQARVLLKASGVPIEVESRQPKVGMVGKKVEIQYGEPTSQIPVRGVLLLGGELTNDPPLRDWLLANRPFDAVVCWNIGTHFIRHKACGSEAQYRVGVQECAYKAADLLLREGGVIHVVDRGNLPSQSEHDRAVRTVLSDHRQLARGTSLVPESVDFREYVPADGGGIPMKESGQRPLRETGAALWSIISRKQ